jgi:hypothetical protein
MAPNTWLIAVANVRSAKAGASSASSAARSTNNQVKLQGRRVVFCQRTYHSRCISRRGGRVQDKRRRAAEAYRSGRDDWQREDEDLNDFTRRSSSLLQATITKANNYVASLSQTIIREFSLDASQEVVSYFIKGVALLTFLTFLKFLLGIFLGVAVLGFLGVFIYKFFLKEGLYSKGGGDSADQRYDDSEQNPYSSMDGDEDVIDVRIWRE